MVRKWWHELTDAEHKALIDSRPTIGQVMKEYRQPPWCQYPDALEGLMGCWSLMDRNIKKVEDCKNCDLCNPDHKEADDSEGSTADLDTKGETTD